MELLWVLSHSGQWVSETTHRHKYWAIIGKVLFPILSISIEARFEGRDNPKRMSSLLFNAYAGYVKGAARYMLSIMAVTGKKIIAMYKAKLLASRLRPHLHNRSFVSLCCSDV